MSSRSLRGNRRKSLQLDLNAVPPSEENSRAARGVDPNDDDDVVELSPTAFAQSQSNQKRKIQRRSIFDTDDETGELPKEIIIDGKIYRSVETGGSSAGENENENENENEDESPEPPPKKPALDCPICISPFEEPMSTRCGHIFCRACLQTAITTQGKCPSCRKKVTKNQPIRVFLPSLS